MSASRLIGIASDKCWSTCSPTPSNTLLWPTKSLCAWQSMGIMLPLAYRISVPVLPRNITSRFSSVSTRLVPQRNTTTPAWASACISPIRLSKNIKAGSGWRVNRARGLPSISRYRRCVKKTLLIKILCKEIVDKVRIVRYRQNICFLDISHDTRFFSDFLLTFTLAFHFAQFDAANLAGDGLGQALDKLDLARVLVGGRDLFDMLLQFRRQCL